jgi:UDP-N-acetylmuramoyl-L-alanyl-D-glutamate--2,6-diaminopimelate ligase
MVPEKEARGILSAASRLIYGEPEKDLTLIGITGANGKTTASYLIETMLKDAGLKPGVLGTVNFRYGDTVLPAPNTTPEGPLLYRTLRAMRDAGCRSAVLEISSHALSLGRVKGLLVDRALFTNLTRDHLDFHGDMESYFKAKLSLFTEHLKDSPGERKVSAVNVSDPWGVRLTAILGKKALSYGIKDADLTLTSVSRGRETMRLVIDSPKGEIFIYSKLLGAFNAFNLMGAAAVGLLLSLSPGFIGESLSSAPGAPGRFSRVGTNPDYLALVDYAHAPGALEAVISAARELSPKRLIVLFGCGGDRDKGKRPMMGLAASRADIAILSSDNPRTEDPMSIILEAEEGLKEGGMERGEIGEPKERGERDGRKERESGKERGNFYFIEPDRKKAIELGVRLMEKGDLLLICGKGHEDYQIIGTEKRRFDDAEEALFALKAAGKS